MKLISHKIFLKHDLEGHPENADRILGALKKFKYQEAKNGEKYLRLIHTDHYIDIVKQSSEHMKKSDEQIYLDAGETYVTKYTYKVACYAVGATVQAAKSAIKGKPAFALVRPPGHHAHPDWTNGFCVFNNIAIASAYLAHKGERVLILDIDIHRGDGTSNCIHALNKKHNDNLFYLSLNQEGLFPGVGIDEGNIHNVYVPPDTSEQEYDSVLEKAFVNVLQGFKPTVVAISAGFDSFETDIQFKNVLGCEQHLTRKTVDLIKRLIGQRKYFVTLEGGYSPESIIQGVEMFIDDKMVSRKKPAKNVLVKKKEIMCSAKHKT